MEEVRVISVVVILAAGAALSFYFVSIYNALVGLQENVKLAWANIDVLLNQVNLNNIRVDVGALCR